MKFASEQPAAPMAYDAKYLEDQLRELRQEVYLIRQFMEAAVVKNKGTPEETIDTLE